MQIEIAQDAADVGRVTVTAVRTRRRRRGNRGIDGSASRLEDIESNLRGERMARANHAVLRDAQEGRDTVAVQVLEQLVQVQRPRADMPEALVQAKKLSAAAPGTVRAASATLPAPSTATSAQADDTGPRAKAQRLEQRIQALGHFGANPAGGVSRVAFSAATSSWQAAHATKWRSTDSFSAAFNSPNR